MGVQFQKFIIVLLLFGGRLIIQSTRPIFPGLILFNQLGLFTTIWKWDDVDRDVRFLCQHVPHFVHRYYPRFWACKIPIESLLNPSRLNIYAPENHGIGRSFSHRTPQLFGCRYSTWHVPGSSFAMCCLLLSISQHGMIAGFYACSVSSSFFASGRV